MRNIFTVIILLSIIAPVNLSAKNVDTSGAAIPAAGSKIFGQTDAGVTGWIDGDELRKFSLVQKNSAIVAAGDSTCAFTPGSRWSDLIEDMPVFAGRISSNTNTCVSGRNIGDLVSSYATEVFPLRPAVTGKNTYLFVEVGSNSLSDTGSGPDAAFSELSGYLSTAKADGFTVVAFTVTPRGSGATGLFNKNYIEAFNTALIAAPDLYDQLVDNYKVLNDPYDTKYYNADRIHPNASGHILTAGEINYIFGGDPITRSLHNSQRLLGSLGVTRESLRAVTTGEGNTASGIRALVSNTEGSGNSAIGNYAGENITTGNYNNALGKQSLWQTTTGGKNGAVGFYALGSNTTGTSNNAFGYESLFTAQTSSFNNAFGDMTLYSNTSGTENNAMGYWALKTNTTGNYNNAFGSLALFGNTTGSFNVAIGNYAGRWQADGSTVLIPNNSVYVGAGTRGMDNNDSNAIVIGYNAIGAGPNTAVLGNSSITKTMLRGAVVLGGDCTPASSSAECVTGTVCGDANYIYRCTATNTWKRTSITSW